MIMMMMLLIISRCMSSTDLCLAAVPLCSSRCVSACVFACASSACLSCLILMILRGWTEPLWVRVFPVLARLLASHFSTLRLLCLVNATSWASSSGCGYGCLTWVSYLNTNYYTFRQINGVGFAGDWGFICPLNEDNIPTCGQNFFVWRRGSASSE